MLGNTLTAPELLRNKGIRFKTWEKWDKTVEMLPCTGQKQYEPNNSWLQNKQIEKGLRDRKDLLGIERVERSSQLAAAEWLPRESRARVTKKSGQEWTSFGLEENLELYLIPEEALLLLELNCLELTWEGVALSVQQAYGVLLGSDRPECNIDEYRVYSHLVRQGYRLQRFRYEDGTMQHDRSIRPRRPSALKRKKVIHDPLDGFGMTRDRIQATVGEEPIKDCSTLTTRVLNDVRSSHETAGNSNSTDITHDQTIEQLNECEMSNRHSAESVSGPKAASTSVRVDRIVDRAGDMPKDRSRTSEPRSDVRNERISDCEWDGEIQSLSESKKHISINARGVKKLPSELYDNGVLNLPGPSNVEAKKVAKNTGKESKLQIISDETLLGDFKIISKRPGSRIQRNVKLMPKRNTGGNMPPVVEKINDGSSRIENITSKGVSLIENTRSRIPGEPSSSGMVTDIANLKGRKRARTQEVIEVSDDEIEEVPQKMSRIEMLNLFPNVISEAFVTKQISRRYLPRNVWPQKIPNRFMKCKVSTEGKRENTGVYEISRVGSGAQRNDVGSRWIKDSASSMNINERTRKNISTNVSFSGSGPRLGNDVGGQISHGNAASRYGSTPIIDHNGISVNYRNEISRQGTWFHKDSFESQTTYQRFYDQATPWVTQSHKRVFGEQEHVSLELGIYTNIAVAQSIWGRSQFFKRGFLHRHNLWTNTSYYHQSKQNLVNFMPRSFSDRASHRNSIGDFSNTARQRPMSNPRRMWDATRYSCNKNGLNSRREANESSFRAVPGASSWAETKAKWLEEKTITIEDEDSVNDEDATVDESEVKVVARLVKPLVGGQNTPSLAQAYKNLQIIKPAMSGNLRRSRKAKQMEHYRISYNLYSTGQHYRKANPGNPMYRIVVFRSEDSPFIESADIARLREDAKEAPVVFACASQTSVTFAELGTVIIPDIQNNHSCER